MGPRDVGLRKSVCCKAQESLGAICCESQIMNSTHRETKGVKGNLIFNGWSPLLHPLKGWNTPEEPKSKPSELNPEESYYSPSPWGGRFTPDVNDRCQAFSAQQTREINNGRLTRREKFQPRVKRQPEENVNEDSCHPSSAADEKQTAESQKWKNHNQRQKGTWRQYEERKHKPTYDGSYSLYTTDKSQATADSRKRKELNERQKDALKRT